MSMSKRVNLGSLKDLAEGEKRSVNVADTQILLCRVQGTLYAVEDLCSHADNALCPGRLTGYMISCPVHSARFDVRNGDHQGPPAYSGIRSFPIEESAAGAIVEIAPNAPEQASFSPHMTR